MRNITNHRASYKLVRMVLVVSVLTFLFSNRSVVLAAGCQCTSTGTTDQTLGYWQEQVDGGGYSCKGARNVNYKVAVVQPGDPAFVMPVSATGAAYCNPLKEAGINLWFRVPTLGDLIGNVIRLIFFIAGLYALVLLLLGGFEWVSSGGEEKKLTSARGKIMNAIIGLVVMVAVLTLVILLEQVVFGGKVCLGISCPINMGQLSIIK